MSERLEACYPAVLEPEESGGFFVRFVDEEGAMTDSGTLDEALFNASEALSGILGWMLDENQPIPDGIVNLNAISEVGGLRGHERHQESL